MNYGPGYRFEREGWIYLHIEGEPYERGFQHGYLAAAELKQAVDTLAYLTYRRTGMPWDYFVAAAEKLFAGHVEDEYLEEIRGIAAGAQAAGVDIDWRQVLAWNGSVELLDYWWPEEKKDRRGAGTDRCSAFIATGTMTGGPSAAYPAAAGRIVMAHNTWDAFVDVQPFHVIIDLVPAAGQRLFMQTAPGLIDSFTDFFVTGAGLMGTETTIAGFEAYEPGGAPEFFRVRKAMQYADSLDRFIGIMLEHNNGGYANSWLLGDARCGEIVKFELGLRYHSVERTTDGCFTGYNAPDDPRIRNLECSGITLTDVRDAIGARRVRLTRLMEDYRGRIDLPAAQAIIADHYDVYLGRINPCSRTVCSHGDLDAREHPPARPEPFEPRGAVDGKVTDSDLAGEMGFWARWGDSCGIPFDADRFLAEHGQWDYLKGYLADRPSRPWTCFNAGMRPEEKAKPPVGPGWARIGNGGKVPG